MTPVLPAAWLPSMPEICNVSFICINKSVLMIAQQMLTRMTPEGTKLRSPMTVELALVKFQLRSKVFKSQVLIFMYLHQNLIRSLKRIDRRVRRMRTHFGDRAFSAASPRCWNSLPPVIHLTFSVDSLKAQLKTHLLVINCRNYYYYYLHAKVFTSIRDWRFYGYIHLVLNYSCCNRKICSDDDASKD